MNNKLIAFGLMALAISSFAMIANVESTQTENLTCASVWHPECENYTECRNENNEVVLAFCVEEYP